MAVHTPTKLMYDVRSGGGAEERREGACMCESRACGLGHEQGARKDGRGNEPLPVRNVPCAEPPPKILRRKCQTAVSLASV